MATTLGLPLDEKQKLLETISVLERLKKTPAPVEPRTGGSYVEHQDQDDVTSNIPRHKEDCLPARSKCGPSTRTGRWRL